MVLHLLSMVLIISQVSGLDSVQDTATNIKNDLQIQLGTLRLRLRHGLHPVLARNVFLDSAYYGREFVKRKIENMNFFRELTQKMDQHKANGKVCLL